MGSEDQRKIRTPKADSASILPGNGACRVHCVSIITWRLCSAGAKSLRMVDAGWWQKKSRRGVHDGFCEFILPADSVPSGLA